MAMSFEQMQALLQQQQKLIETLAEKLTLQATTSSMADQSRPLVDAIAQTISEFQYDPIGGVYFDAWFRKYEDTFRVELAQADDAHKVRILLRKLGPAEHERYTNFILPKNPREFSFDETVNYLSQIFGEQSSLFKIRYQCLKLVKNEADDFITYAGIVNRESERFKLRTMTDDQFKALIFVCGLQSPTDADVRSRILNMMELDPDMTLQSITSECQRLLNLKNDAQMIANQSGNSQVNVMRTSHSRSTRKPFNNTTRSNSKPPTACWKCGQWHYVRLCPFKRHLCQKCLKRGHKEEWCQGSERNNAKRTTRSKQSQSPRKRIESNSVSATFKVDFASRRKFVTLSINNVPVRLQLDTASDITILSQKTWTRLGKPPVKPSNHKALTASGSTMNLIGELSCDVSFNDVSFKGLCYLTKSSRLNLLGLDWIEELHLFDVPLRTVCNNLHSKTHKTVEQHQLSPSSDMESIQREHAEIFRDELGCCTKTQAVLHLKPDSKPVFRPKRPVPYAALSAVETELQRLQRAGVLKPVNYSSWAASIVVVKKPNGSVRICADFSTGLNNALDSHQYPLPLPEDLFNKLNGGRCFAKIDLSDAYLQVPVAEESQELLTINTHKGLFQYTRLPFGVKTASSIFQQIMDTMLTHLPGTAAYLDDIIVTGANRTELSSRLRRVLTRIGEYGFRIRKEKCCFFMNSIKHLGFIIDKNGRRPDPSNITAIQQMPPPSDVTTLRSFLGLVSYYSAFLPSMHRARAPLNLLLKKDQRWEWTPECQKAFDDVKSMLKSDLLLTHYNPSLDILVASDVSSRGIGAVITHVFPDGSQKAVAHAARSLTSAESNYSQIEKEALTIVFAVKKFHKMLFGRRFTLLTDHKPLLAIFGSKKGIPVYTANRLQRWATLLLNYDFQLKYTSSTSIGQADALSRLIGKQPREPEDTVVASIYVDPEVNSVFHDVLRALPVTADMVREATKQDDVLQRVLKFHCTSWPKTGLYGDLQQFAQRKHSLSVVNGCLMFGERVVIPKSIRHRLIHQFHSSHPGINRMKAIARSYAYWPGMDKELEALCRSCSKCALALKAPAKTTPHSWPTPYSPWSRVHVDFAGPINGQSFLIVVDAFSKWPEIIRMSNTSADYTVAQIREIFARFGCPETLVSDNGTQFTSKIFAEFCKHNGIDHIRSPPYHPQSNGQAERFVDTFKRALLKSKGEGTTSEILDKFLLYYRATPNQQTPGGVSPSEALFGRRIRTPLDLIRPQTRKSPEPQNVVLKSLRNQHSANKRLFNPGDTVLARDYRRQKPSWTLGKIKRRCGEVIYEVAVGTEIWIRHTNQLRHTGCTQLEQTEEHLPLDILLDTFRLPPVEPKATRQKKARFRPPPWLPHRRSDRKRTTTDRLQIDPKRQSYADPLQRGGVRSVRLLTKSFTLQRAKRTAKACPSNRQQLPCYWSIACQPDRTQDTSHTRHSGKKANRSIDVDTPARSIGHLGRM